MVKIDLRSLGIPLLLLLFVCLFLNQENNKIFPKQTSWNGFVAIHLLFFFIKADKTVWNNDSFLPR